MAVASKLQDINNEIKKQYIQQYEYTSWPYVTNVYWHNWLATLPIVMNQGGSRSSKTVSILQVIFDLLVLNKNWKATVTGQDFPNLSSGALSDFRRLLNANPKMKLFLKNAETPRGPFTFYNGSILEFRAFQTAQDAKAGTREILFINECNGVAFEIYEELQMRTNFRTFLDFNPSAEFWAHTMVKPNTDRCKFIRSTFADNPYCPEQSKAKIKSFYVDWKRTGLTYYQNKWLVYGLGLTGLVEGAVIQNYKVVPKFADKSELDYFGYGIDFGFTDPLAIGRNGIQKNGRIITQQVLYESGIRFYALDWLMPKLGIKKTDPIIADSGGVGVDAVPWLASKGWNIVGAKKGPGSIKAGNQLLNEKGIDLVQGSDQFLKEYGSYIYLKKDGKYDKDLPTDKDNHGVDQLRYFVRWAELGLGVVDTDIISSEAGAYVGNSDNGFTRGGMII